jgi:tetratricopeptide (TPR) repeat protein
VLDNLLSAGINVILMMCARRFIPLSLLFLVAVGVLRAAGNPEKWLEVRSPHFIVIANGNEKQARRVAQQFELIRGVFKLVYPNARLDPGEPVIILAGKDEKTLRALLPGYWEKKGQARPGGVFVHGQEKNYVALRLDAPEANPYHVIYHEYVHLLASLNFRWLPVWVSEGLAEFFASVEIEGKTVLIGRPTAEHLRLLRRTELIPLDTLFAAGHDSPFYNEENKASIFYAESWAVIHYLLVGDNQAHEDLFIHYLSLLQNEVDEPVARQRAFGDLGQLKQEIEAYLRLFSFYGFRVKAPETVDPAQFTVREVTPAASAAVRGDFLLHTQRLVEARALLEEALRLDPSFAPAQESMGFLHFQAEDYDEAAECFEKAVQLDSRSYLAQYYFAMLKAREFQGKGNLSPVEGSLRRAIELNSQFAPAYANLAGLFLRQQKNPEEALALARRAVQLEPGAAGYQVILVSALIQNRRMDEARHLAERIRATATSPEELSDAENLLASIQMYQEYDAARQRAEERARADEGEFKRKWEETQQAIRERGRQEKEDEAAAQPAPAFLTGKSKAGWSSGRVEAVSCVGSSVELTLQGTLGKLRLHSEDYGKIEILTTSWTSPQPFDPCQNLDGHQAAIFYRQYGGSPYDGEIVSIEVRE